MSTVRQYFIIAFLIALFVSGCEKDNPTSSSMHDDAVFLRSSSPHFNYFSTLRDNNEVVDTLKVLLETNLERVSALYNFSIDDTIDVYIYPTFEMFHANVEWGTDTIPATLVGQCVEANVIRFISPLSAEPINSYSEMLTVAVHESMHAIHFHVFNPLPATMFPPSSIFEGFATYEAKQFPNRNIIHQRVISGDLPLIEQYNDYYFFTANYGYHFCYTIYEYLIDTYGYDKVSHLLRYPTRIAEALGENVTMDSLNAGWHQFIIQNY